MAPSPAVSTTDSVGPDGHQSPITRNSFPWILARGDTGPYSLFFLLLFRFYFWSKNLDQHSRFVPAAACFRSFHCCCRSCAKLTVGFIGNLRGRADASLFPQSRCLVDRAIGRSMRRLLSILVRWMAEEESNSSRPDFLERVREAIPGQSSVPARDSRGGSEGEVARCGHAKDRRLLHRVNGRSRCQPARHPGYQT